VRICKILRSNKRKRACVAPPLSSAMQFPFASLLLLCAAVCSASPALFAYQGLSVFCVKPVDPDSDCNTVSLYLENEARGCYNQVVRFIFSKHHAVDGGLT